MRTDRRAGMTLLEVLAALAIIGFVILGAVLLLEEASDSGERITAEGKKTTSGGAGAQMFKRQLMAAAPSADTSHRFRGDERYFELPAQCERPQGWSAPCQLTIAIDSTADSTFLIERTDDQQSNVVRRFAGAGQFRYFAPTLVDSVWVKTWDAKNTFPLAVALLLESDTLVFPVGVARE